MNNREVANVLTITEKNHKERLEKLLNKRITGASRFTEVKHSDWLLTALKISNWEVFDHPNIEPECIGYWTKLRGTSKLRMIENNDIIRLARHKKTNKTIATVETGNGKICTFSCIIIGAEHDNETVLTFHPGSPVSARNQLTFQEPILGNEAVALGFSFARILTPELL